MRSRRWTSALVAALLAAGSPAVAADEVQQELRELRDMVTQLKDQVRAQQQQIQTQNELITQSDVAAGGSSSGLAAFFQETNFYGFVSASYQFNTANKSNDGIFGQNNSAGAANAGIFTRPDSNTFAIDQVWFTMDHAATEDSRGGFHVDLLWGNAAEQFNGRCRSGCTDGAFNGGDSPELYTAYVSYLAPIGSGVQIDAGKLATPMGAEVLQTTENFNITRGLVYNLQPINHTGVIASTDLGGGLSLALGAVNAVFSDATFDTDNGKAFTGRLGLDGDGVSAGLSAIYGAQLDAAGVGADEDDKAGVVDLVLTADPSEQLSLWLNFDWAFTEGTGFDTDQYGVAVAGRLALLESTGFSVRGEFVRTNVQSDPVGGFDGRNWSVTGTLDHALTDALTMRGEARYDFASIDDFEDDVFFDSSGFATKDDRLLLIAEMIYAF